MPHQQGGRVGTAREGDGEVDWPPPLKAIHLYSCVAVHAVGNINSRKQKAKKAHPLLQRRLIPSRWCSPAPPHRPTASGALAFVNGVDVAALQARLAAHERSYDARADAQDARADAQDSRIAALEAALASAISGLTSPPTAGPSATPTTPPTSSGPTAAPSGSPTAAPSIYFAVSRAAGVSLDKMANPAGTFLRCGGPTSSSALVSRARARARALSLLSGSPVNATTKLQ